MRRLLPACLLLTVVLPVRSWASDIYLDLFVDTASHTWTVTATSSDNLNLGIAAFSIDLVGSGGISILPMPLASQTLCVGAQPFSLFRCAGIINGTSLTNIHASQDVIGAAMAGSDSLLEFGGGLTGTAAGTFIGEVASRGALTLATGRYIDSGSGGTIMASLTPGAFINLLPLNYDASASADAKGAMHAAPTAAHVRASVAMLGSADGLAVIHGSPFEPSPPPRVTHVPPASTESPAVTQPSAPSSPLIDSGLNADTSDSAQPASEVQAPMAVSDSPPTESPGSSNSIVLPAADNPGGSPDFSTAPDPIRPILVDGLDLTSSGL